MYHYVRDGSPDLPDLRYLHLDDFRRQLDWLGERFEFPSRDEVFAAVAGGRAPSGVVLTFDDGLRDHYEHVLPELERRGLWGFFFVPTGMYRTRQLLGVHRIHALLACFDPEVLLEAVTPLVRDEMLTDAGREEFRSIPYATHDVADSAIAFKRTLNYFVSYEWRGAVLDRLMSTFFGDEAALVDRHYLSVDQLREMAAAGMEIGSHGDLHLVMSKLPADEQRRDLADSFEWLAATLGTRPRSFCHPYGGDHTFDRDTEVALAELGCQLAFNVEPRDATDDDVRERVQRLPRYDCNELPHGRAR